MVKLLTFLLTLHLTCFVVARYPVTIEELIVGGESAKIEDIPYQAGFYYFDFYFCAGIIITRKHVLTAAHCVEFFKKQTKGLTVRVGTAEMLSGGQVIRVEKIFIHPNFSSKYIDYDAAIAELPDFLKLTHVVQPIEIGKSEPKEGAEVRVSGWGFIKEHGGPSRRLQVVSVTVVDRKACSNSYKNKLTVTKRMICASGDRKDACYGDSGGPLVHKNKLVGIVSSGEGCARKEYPGVYTNVLDPDIRSFIKNVTNV